MAAHRCLLGRCWGDGDQKTCRWTVLNDQGRDGMHNPCFPLVSQRWARRTVIGKK